MAWVAMEDKVKVGFLVYDAYYPQNPGIVRRIVKDWIDTPYPNHPETKWRKVIVEVEWLKETKDRKKVTVQGTTGLMDFNQLIADHKRKYEKQTKLAEQLRKMK